MPDLRSHLVDDSIIGQPIDDHCGGWWNQASNFSLAAAFNAGLLAPVPLIRLRLDAERVYGGH